MSQVASGTQFGRHSLADRKNDLYETPPCATRALIPFLDPAEAIWEPACGPGRPPGLGPIPKSAFF